MHSKEDYSVLWLLSKCETSLDCLLLGVVEDDSFGLDPPECVEPLVMRLLGCILVLVVEKLVLVLGDHYVSSLDVTLDFFWETCHREQKID